MLLKRLIALSLFITPALGPATSVRAQWVQTNGPAGGNITSLAVSGQSIFAASDGIFRSNDHGTSWILVDTITGATNLASGDDAVFVLSNSSLLRSTDAGIHWDSAGLNNVEALSVKGKSLLAGSSDSIHYSIDNGSTWRTFPRPKGKSNSINFVSIRDNSLLVSFLDQYDPNPPHEIIAKGGVYATSDFGSTWDSIYPKQFYSIAQMGNENFAVSPNGVLISTANDWRAITSLPSQLTIRTITTIGSDLYAVAYGIGLYRSTDSGSNWELTDVDLKGRDIHSVVADGPDILASSDDGLYRSTDQGSTWSELSMSGASTYHILSVPDGLIAVDGDIISYPGSSPIFFSSNEGDSWQRVANGFALGANTIFTLGPLFFATTGAGLACSSDHGVTWSIRSKDRVWGNFINSNGILFETSVHDVFRSDDSGSTWTKIGSGIDTIAMNCEIVGIAALGSTVFTWDDCGWAVFRTTNNGLTWNRYSGPGGGTTLVFQGSILFATTQQGLYRSTDTGASWTNVLSVRSPIINVFSEHYILAGDYLSTDSGLTWTSLSSSFNSGLWNLRILSLAVHDHYLFAGTYGGGVWRRLLSDLDTTVSTAIPSLIAYPNPFSSVTTIRYTLPNITEATITIYDALGRLVTTLFSQDQAPGAYEIRFQPNGLESGTYWCCLTSINGIRAIPLAIEPK